MKITCNLAEYNQYHDDIDRMCGTTVKDWDVDDAKCMHCQRKFFIQGLKIYTTPDGEKIYMCRDCMSAMNKAINTAINAFTRKNNTSVVLADRSSQVGSDYSIKEVAGILNVTPQTIRVYMKKIGVPFKRYSHQNRVTREQLEKIRRMMSDRSVCFGATLPLYDPETNKVVKTRKKRCKNDESKVFLEKRDKLFDTFDWNSPKESYSWTSPKAVVFSESNTVTCNLLASLAKNGLIEKRVRHQVKKDKVLYLLPKQKV